MATATGTNTGSYQRPLESWSWDSALHLSDWETEYGAQKTKH